MIKVVQSDQLDWMAPPMPEKFGARVKSLGQGAAPCALGANLIELAPSKQSFPRHCHAANDEAIFMLEGSAKLHRGEDSVIVNAGDYVTMPRSTTEAHTVINHTDAPCRYLCFSTMNEPEIMFYPDSEKVGLLAGRAPGDFSKQASFNSFARLAEVPYFDGED